MPESALCASTASGSSRQQVDVRIRLSVVSGPGSEQDDTLGMNLVHPRGDHTIEHVLVHDRSAATLAPAYSAARPAFPKMPASTSSDLVGGFVMRHHGVQRLKP